MDLVPLSSLISNRHRDSLPRAKRVQMVELVYNIQDFGQDGTLSYKVYNT